MNHVLQILLFAVTIFGTGSMTSDLEGKRVTNAPVENISIYEGERLSVYVSERDHISYFDHIKYIQSDDQLNMVTFEEIKWIQITNDQGDLIFRIPVESNDLNISLSTFDSGLYHLQLLFGDQMKQIVSEIMIK